MKYYLLNCIGMGLCILLLSNCAPVQNQEDLLHGPLRVSERNPRYFTDDSGKAIYLTGSHTWNNLVDMAFADSLGGFDFVEYLQWLKGYNHNFIRLWAWELINWNTPGHLYEVKDYQIAPQPWARSGNGTALDGKQKFDLSLFNPVYFDRLKERVEQAADEGIYVSIMLFEGWGLQFATRAFENHPFHPDNNINGVNGDSDHDGSGVEIHTLENPEITAIQEAYIRKVIDVVNEFDNVLYEISNENHAPSTEWQYHMIAFIKEYEKKLEKQHPVGMTYQYKGGSNEILEKSPADWISPNPQGGYRDNPPPSDGSKVILTDTDHLWGIGGNSVWVWKSFLRGLNPIFMDCYDSKVLTWKSDSAWVEPLRKSMGYTRMFAQRMDLINMIPDPDLSSSKYCLANNGLEYLIYIPDSLQVTLNLEGVSGSFKVEWFDPCSGEFMESDSQKGGSKLSFKSPFDTHEVVLHLKAK